MTHSISSLAAVMIVAASAIGWAVLMGALAVLYAMDLRNHRWLPAAGWVATAGAGGWLAVMPSLTLQPPPWAVLILALSLALLIWHDLEKWPRRARARSRDYLFGA